MDTRQYYFILDHWQHGPNLTLTILYDHLVKHITKLGQKPDTIFLEVVNCYKESEKIHCIASLASLYKFLLIAYQQGKIPAYSVVRKMYNWIHY